MMRFMTVCAICRDTPANGTARAIILAGCRHRSTGSSPLPTLMRDHPIHNFAFKWSALRDLVVFKQCDKRIYWAIILAGDAQTFELPGVLLWTYYLKERVPWRIWTK
jgi:hypothetical protein